MVPYPYMRTLYPISPYLNPVYHPDAVEYLNSYYNLYDGKLIAESKCVKKYIGSNRRHFVTSCEPICAYIHSSRIW